jgi:hypothetical protein
MLSTNKIQLILTEEDLNHSPLELEFLHDPTVSDWLKSQIRATKTRDVLDAWNDAQILLDLLQRRWQAVVAGNN